MRPSAPLEQAAGRAAALWVASSAPWQQRQEHAPPHTSMGSTARTARTARAGLPTHMRPLHSQRPRRPAQRRAQRRRWRGRSGGPSWGRWRLHFSTRRRVEGGVQARQAARQGPPWRAAHALQVGSRGAPSPPTEISTLVRGLRCFSSAMAPLTTAGSELQGGGWGKPAAGVRAGECPARRMQAQPRMPDTGPPAAAAHAPARLKLRPVPWKVTPPV